MEEEVNRRLSQRSVSGGAAAVLSSDCPPGGDSSRVPEEPVWKHDGEWMRKASPSLRSSNPKQEER